MKVLFAAGLLVMLASGPVLPSFVARAADDAEEIENDIEKIEKKLKEAEKKKEGLQEDLGAIVSSITVTQQVIARTEKNLVDTEQNISSKEAEIRALEGEMELERALLAGLFRELYERRMQSFDTHLLGGNATEALRGDESLGTIEDKMSGLLDELERFSVRLTEERSSLEETKDDHARLLRMKNEQKKTLTIAKVETQTDLQEQQATIGELQGKLSRLKSSLSSLLGKSYNAKDIEDAAEFAAKKTGVRKDFLMGMLVVESDLGRYTGGCTYAEVEKGAEQRYKSGKLTKAAWASFQRRRDIFKQIAKELDRDYKKQKVSCNPASYYGTGGAMGVPQFMPDTWMGYKTRIANATGHNPPDPWNLTDGVMAMAIKLAVVPGVTKGQRSAEKNAAKIYLSGTTSAKYNWYGDKVLYWADNYERLL
jgi:peptidoglycan hydrolase CwlO-like protein